MTRDDAHEALRIMVRSLDRTDPEAAKARLLERVSLRVDCIELRAALAELGAEALLKGEA